MSVKVISRYDYESRAAEAPGVHFDPKKKADRSLTNQADMDAADINKIMARYEKTGVLVDDLGNTRQPMYGDFTEVKDYHTMLSAIRRAESAFALLPADVRNRFNNDPQALIDFLEDNKNDEEAVKLGLKDKAVLLTATDPDTGAKITKSDFDFINKLSPEKREARKKELLAAKAANEAAAGGAGAAGQAGGAAGV